MTAPSDPSAFVRHTAYSDPGRYAALVRALPSGLDELCATSRNLVAHYRAELPDLPVERRGEIDSRWTEAILALDQSRHPADLTRPRPVTERVAGCCRDHALLLTGFLRTHGVPARTVVGFAGYFAPPFHHDHVVVELHDGIRWIRTDPELADSAAFGFDVRDMPTGVDAPFQTAAEVWSQYRAGRLDPDQYGVDVDAPAFLRGAEFIAGYVVFQLAHRYGDELLLWDEWFSTPSDDVLDRLASLLIAADAGDADAERVLHTEYLANPRLRPGDRITLQSPYGSPSVTVDLPTRSVVKTG